MEKRLTGSRRLEEAYYSSSPEPGFFFIQSDGALCSVSKRNVDAGRKPELCRKKSVVTLLSLFGGF